MEPAVTGRRDVQYRATVGVDAAEPSRAYRQYICVTGPQVHCRTSLINARLYVIITGLHLRQCSIENEC